MSTLNDALSDLKDEILTTITTGNGYNFTPTVHLGAPPDRIPHFPYISVWLVSDIEIEEMIGPTMVMTVPVTLSCFTKGQQGENAQNNNNKMIEDVLQYLLNDVTLNILAVDQTINIYHGDVERGDAYFVSEITARLKIEYTKETINT